MKKDKKSIMFKKKRFYVLLFFEAVVIFLVHIFNINKLYGFYLSEDELGYWGNAAYMLGKDWGNALKSCAYYSQGYSFFLMLIMSLPLQPLTMYRFAIAANALFMVGIFCISCYLFMELFPQRNKIYVSISCMAMALYASYIAQSSAAWSECYLTFVVWLILLQAYFVCKKATFSRVLIFAVEVVYLYIIHQRTVGVFIAGIIFIVYMIKYQKLNIKYLIITVAVMGSMIFGAVILKNHIQAAIYSSDNLVNTWSTTLKGMNLFKLFIPTIKETCGQLYYLWASSFGIVPLGMATMVWMCISNWKKRKNNCYFAGFVLLAFLGIFAISCVWIAGFFPPSTVDYFLYGRFNEIIIGFFVVSGFMALPDFVRLKNGRKILGISCAAFLALAAILFYQIQTHTLSQKSYHGVCSPGFYWAHSMSGEIRVWEVSAFILAVVFLMFELGRWLADKKWIFAVEAVVFIVFWIWSGEQVIQKQIIPYQIANNYDMTVKTDILQYINNSDDVTFLTNELMSNRGTMQLYMPDKPLQCIIREENPDEKLNEKPDILIIDNSALEINIPEGYYLAGTLSGKNVFSLKEVKMNKEGFFFNSLETEESGYVMSGPYISLGSGFYEVTFHMGGNFAEESDMFFGMIDVATDMGSSTISSTQWDGTSQSITMSFNLQEKTDNVEFRYFKYEGNDTFPTEITVKKIG